MERWRKYLDVRRRKLREVAEIGIIRRTVSVLLDKQH
jgi:hypothetical protein